MTRVIEKICCAGVLFVLCLLAAPFAEAEDVTIASASPYQLANLLQEANPTYDVRINADLVYSSQTTEKMPALVFMHGSGGRLARHQRYLELARALGFATLQIDSFRARGIGSTVGNQANVTAAMMTVDALRGLDFLTQRPDIDANKIVIMGSSKGATAALYATWAPTRRKVAGDLDFAGYVLLYPYCTTIEDGDVTTNPVHVFIGEKDNWTPPAPCLKQAERMKARGRNWAITLYEDAYHGFDAPIKGIRNMPYAYSMVGCNIALRADGYEYETGSGYLLSKATRRKAFANCAKKGAVKMGGSDAGDVLFRDIKTFLTTIKKRRP